MENKTAAEILENHWESNQKNEPFDEVYFGTTDSCLLAMKEYAEQEIRRHLEIAATNAKLSVNNNGDESIEDEYQVCDDYGDSHVIIIDKESITGIKIEL